MSDANSTAYPHEQIAALRASLGDTGEQFGARIGLSKSRVSELETGKYACSVRVAIAIEDLSGGRIDAASLCDDVRLARLATAAPPLAEGIAE